jgi:hypothetical protein
VFARDPDALLDYIELDLTDDLIKQEENKAVCKVCELWLIKHVKDWEEEVSQDDQCSEKAMLPACEKLLGPDLYKAMLNDVYAARQAIQQRTAWRIDGTLREFPKFKPVNLWFNYPTHQVDTDGLLKDQESEGDKAPWQRAIEKRKPKEVKKKDRKIALENAFEACSIDEEVTVIALEEYMGVTKNTIKNRVKEHGGFEINYGIVKKIEGVKKQKNDTDS